MSDHKKVSNHGIKIATFSISAIICFGFACGVNGKVQAKEEAVSAVCDTTNVSSCVLRLDRQVGVSIEQKKNYEQSLEAQAQAEAAAAAAAAKAAEEQQQAEAQKAAEQTANNSYTLNAQVSDTSKSSSKLANSSVGEKIVAAAMSKIGTPYGAVINGVTFDCSGLVQWACKQAGISISRSSYTQVNDCAKVSRNELQLGDLIFWQSGGVINHVGIYAGNGMVIDASPHGVVKRAIFSSPSQSIACYGRPR